MHLLTLLSLDNQWYDSHQSNHYVLAEATKRGLGSALLRKPPKLARLVAGIAEGIELPLTVKVRTGTSYSKINAQEVRIASEP